MKTWSKFTCQLVIFHFLSGVRSDTEIPGVSRPQAQVNDARCLSSSDLSVWEEIVVSAGELEMWLIPSFLVVPLTSIYGFRGVLGIPECTWSHSKDKLALIGLLLVLYVHLIDQPGFIVHETIVINIISLKTNKPYSGLHRLDCPPRGGLCIAVKTVLGVPSFLKANRCQNNSDVWVS